FALSRAARKPLRQALEPGGPLFQGGLGTAHRSRPFPVLLGTDPLVVDLHKSQTHQQAFLLLIARPGEGAQQMRPFLIGQSLPPAPVGEVESSGKVIRRILATGSILLDTLDVGWRLWRVEREPRGALAHEPCLPAGGG